MTLNFPVDLQQLQTATPQAELDAALHTLHENKARWARMSVQARILLLEQIGESFKTVLEEWALAGIRAKRIPEGHSGIGDEWAFVAVVFRQLSLLRQSLQDIQRYGVPRTPKPLYTRADGQVIAPVFPNNLKDKAVYNGIRGEVWFNEGVTVDQVLAKQASIYRSAPDDGKLALVLGAGNVSALLPGDFMYKLFAENQVVVLKMNPVNAYLGALIERGYRPLIEQDALRVVYGGVEEGTYLIEHPLVEEIHVTGSDKTYDAIVFGTGDEGAARKRARTPKMTKRFTAELGNLTPVIVVPGAWSADDIALQGGSIGGQLTVNAGCNCLTPRVIVQHANWNQREALNAAINATLAKVPTRYAYYPRSAERHAAFLEAHPDAHLHGDASDGKLPWTYIQGVNPLNTEDIVFNTEAFCSVMAETALEASDVVEYIDKAVAFVNNHVWGTLTATIIVHPDSLQDPAISAAVDRAIANLRYGAVCVNISGAIAYAIAATSWGGHSGSPSWDIQSGYGVVNNALLFDGEQIQKSVLYAPFRTPLASQDLSDARFPKLSKGIAWLEAEPSLKRVLELVRVGIGI